MEKEIYLLYSCDDWKSYSSFRLVMASTNENEVRKEVIKQVDKGYMDYDSCLDELETLDLESINNILEYGFINIVKDGELQ